MGSPGGASMIEKLSIPDGVHTLSQQCMQRCGITEDYYKNFKCPTELPFKNKVLEPFAPTITTTTTLASDPSAPTTTTTTTLASDPSDSADDSHGNLRR